MLENIKDASLTQLQAVKDQGQKQLRDLKKTDKSKTIEAIDEIKIENKMMKQINQCLNLEKSIEHLIKKNLFVQKLMELNMTFNVLPLKFIEKNHNYEITQDEAIEDQIKLQILVNKLNSNYNRRSVKKQKRKTKFQNLQKKLFHAREDISGLLKRGTFPYKGDIFKRKKEKTEEKSEKKSEEESKEKIKDEYIKYIDNE